MNILVLQESNWAERGPHQQHHLMESLSLGKHNVHVIDYDILWESKENHRILKPKEVFYPEGKSKKGAKIKLIRPAIVQMPLLSYLSIPITHSLAIVDEIRRFKPDVIVSFGILNAFAGRIISRFYGVPFTCYLIDHLYTLLPLKQAKPIAKVMEAKVMSSSDKVFVINKGLKDYAISMGAKPESVSIVPGGVDAERYRVASKRRGDVRKALGISERDVVLFFMGWIYNFSGLVEVADALVRWNGPTKYKLMVVGDGDAFNELRGIKEKHHLDGLLLLGKQPFGRIPELLSAADICLLPANPKAPEMQNIVPIKLYEYLAAGKPVIATRLPGIIKEFGFGNGVSYVFGPEEVLDRCSEMVENDDLETEGRRLQDEARQYDWSGILDTFEAQLIDIVAAIGA